MTNEFTLLMERIAIFTGNFGSGKTEVSMQYAINSAAAGNATQLVDLDIVNPYFTSGMQQQRMQEYGIEVIAPTYSGTGMDVPALNVGMQTVFYGDKWAVVDLGGDPTGATVLGRYAHLLDKQPYQLLFVLNPMRPFTQDAQSAYEMMLEIQQHAKVEITGIVNNANLGQHTQAEHLLKGNEIAGQLARRTGLPVVYHCGEEQVIQQAAQQTTLLGQPFVLHPINHPDWQAY
ncbi:hypothetical protein LJC55_00165 [Eubacteriales bacterium OttesenSCG-928-N14]|nr:hypothetical protein [Eubacteriales bacterium OttesenSCG-928-N14]